MGKNKLEEDQRRGKTRTTRTTRTRSTLRSSRRDTEWRPSSKPRFLPQASSSTMSKGMLSFTTREELLFPRLKRRAQPSVAQLSRVELLLEPTQEPRPVISLPTKTATRSIPWHPTWFAVAPAPPPTATK